MVFFPSVRSSFGRPRRHGSVLLEVVLALALFVGAATAITAGINASIESARRLRLQNHAADLAISVMSEMHMQARPAAPVGPEPFPAPFQEWTFKVEIAENPADNSEANSLRPVEVIVRHSQENIVRRVTELFRPSDLATGTNETSDSVFQSSAFR